MILYNSFLIIQLQSHVMLLSLTLRILMFNGKIQESAFI